MNAQAWAECAAVTTLAALQADLVTWACGQLYLHLSSSMRALQVRQPHGSLEPSCTQFLLPVP